MVGGGISGLTAARSLLRRAGGRARIVLVEAEERLGGKVKTEPLEGLPVEAGPDSFLTRVPSARILCEELGLGAKLVAPAVDGSFVWSRGQLRRLPPGLVLGFPSSPWATARSGILSPAGVARAAADLFLTRERLDADVSVGALVLRRFGREVLDRLVDPLLGGIHGGRADQLSLRATAPPIESAARSHRSLILGFRSLRKQQRVESMAQQEHGSSFLTVEGGLERIVEAIRQDLAPASVLLGRPVRRLDAGLDGGFRLDVGGEEVSAHGVVLAVPAFAAAELVRGLAPPASADLAAIPYASTAIVALIYPPEAGELPVGGSGFLVPAAEGRLIKGCTWVSAKWPHLTPADGGMVVRCSVGGAGYEHALALDDRSLVTRVVRELDEMAGLRVRPRTWRVTRWENALPQYTVGHLDRLEHIESLLPPGIALAGAAYRGAGIPDCIRQGEEAAARVLEAVLAQPLG